jgi:bacterioferritin
VDNADNASRALLEDLLKETENDHIRWLESQLFLIKELGLSLYLAQQI